MRSLEARLSRLEQAAGIGRNFDPLFIILAIVDAHDGRPVRKEVFGYSWNGGKAERRPGETSEEVLKRAEREALPYLEPWGGIVLNEMVS